MENNLPENPVMPETKFQIISLDLIDDPARPVRSDLSPESVEDLVVSIKQVGIIQPLVVKPVAGRFEVVAGHRRLVAAGVAGLVNVPCYIVEANNQQAELMKLHENLYRADVRPSDEAEHFKFLMESHKLSPVKLGKLLGKSESYVLARLAIFSYPPELKTALDKGEIKFSVAVEFSKITDNLKMREYLNYAIRSGITPGLARQWVEDWKRSVGDVPLQEIKSDGVGGSAQIVEHFSNCIRCENKLKLSEAEVVYMCRGCLEEIKSAAKN